MKFAGWLSAAIEILDTIEQRHLPVKHGLNDWGRSHRFAGSKDRAAIGNLVYDIARHKASLAWVMESQEPRALALAASVYLWGETADSLTAHIEGDKFAPDPLSEHEVACLNKEWDDVLTQAPLWVQANIPEWLEAPLTSQFQQDLVKQAQAMSLRAPIDIRVNALKANSEKVMKALSRYKPAQTRFCETTLRFAPITGGKKSPNLEAEAAHGKGWFEVQDEGSQLACLLAGVKPGDQVLDLCAGAGGKTLALSALMENKGQIHAYDNDKQRLRPIFERLKRAGCRNVQTYDAGNEVALEGLKGAMDVVFVDAPCTGSGTWRRHPDSKWRLSEKSLNMRLAEQKNVLGQAVTYLKPGGRLVYVTCSLLPEENEEQISTLLQTNTDLEPRSIAEQWKEVGNGAELRSANGNQTYLTLSPHQHETDGFFIALLQKAN